uniref:Protein kinase domain-containing protein n=1 Tax=Daphnia galeata TaxID=27404 RepID=A0A8J2RRS7_9CRUS|nr:unnamed protein product [Daphnia galeata]
MAELCPGELGFIPSSVNFLRSDKHGQILKWTIEGKYVLVKKISLDTIHHEDKRSLHSHWEKLAQLRDDHLLQYHLSDVQDDGIRYLVPMIDLCQGSMLDYCRKTLDKNIASYIKATDVMWQITCGLAYLQRHKIDQGRLKLKNVFFWKRNLKSKRVVVKLTGYGYNNYHKCEGKMDIIPQLGCLFYSAATKEEAKPNEPISLHSLTEIEDNHKALALDLIRFLINGSISNGVEVSALFRHPLFTRCTDEGRSRLIQDSTGDNAGLIWNDKVKIQKWLESVDERNFPEEDFDDFKDVLLETENNDIAKIVSDAFKDTPQLFSEYIWHATIGSEEMRNTVREEKNKTHSIDKLEILGKGNYGEVYKCQYTDGNGKTYPAACKKATLIEGEEGFEKEIEILRKLSHLFVVKYLDVVERDSKKFIVMELCDGSLREYVEGKLELIPKDSLDEKILIGEVCLGLAYIHSKGIIHKDLKLENILLKRQPSGLVLAKIADFGFAKELKSGKSEFSVTSHPGTETYMAPELLNAKPGAYPATFASDVYALGITIARIVLKGKHPFSHPDINEIWCKISMIKGLVPQNLEGLSWDLIDLILKLTDKDPAKRPEMVLVLRHPYFVLTNEKTKEYFVDQLWADLDLLEIFSKDYERNHLQNIFNGRNFREWYETIFKDKVETAEEKEEMAKTLQLLKRFGSGDQADTALKAAKQYEETIKKAIKSDHDTKSENRIDQMFPPKYGLTYVFFLSWGRLNKLIQRAPKLFVPYLWSHMQNGGHGRKRGHSKFLIISELEWSSLYYNDEKIVDELWNIKYSENYEKDVKTILGIINIVRKCNVSERVWSALLNGIDKNAAVDLIFSAVKSHSSSAPKATEMILQRYGITEEMATVINMAASNEGDWADEIMQIILNYGGNPNANKMDESSCKGWTPVHYAAENESRMGPKIMKLLLGTKRCDVNALSIEKVAPIHLATNNKGDYAADILKLLIDNGAACDVIDGRLFNFCEPIHFALMNDGESSPKLLDLLLKKRGVNHNSITEEIQMLWTTVDGPLFTTPLEELLTLLLQKGGDPNLPDKKFKATPVHFVAQGEGDRGDEKMKILLQNGGNPNATDEMGCTPVHYAATNEGEQAFEMMELLLANGGKLDFKNKNGFTPGHFALLNIGICGVKIRELCGDSEKIANLPFNDSGETLLHFMINYGAECKIEQIQAILDNGGNPNVVDNRGWSPVHYAVRRYQASVGLDIIQLLTLLLQKGGDPNLPDKQSKATPVHCVAQGEGDREDEKMKILLENGGNANAVMVEGTTPLHLTVKNSGIHGPEVTRMLLEHGGNPNSVTNVNKRTPLHCALIMETNINDQLRFNIIKHLLEKGGNPNARDVLGNTPVHYIIGVPVGNSLEVLKLLLKHGGNILQKDNLGLTPHHIAQIGIEQYCNREVMKHILKTSREMIIAIYKGKIRNRKEVMPIYNINNVPCSSSETINKGQY